MKTNSFFFNLSLSLALLFSFFMMGFISIIHAADGDFVWAKSMGGTVDDIGNSIFVDSSGYVYSTGYFQGTNVDFDPGAGTFPLTSTGNADIFISKLDSSGNLVWVRSIGGVADDVGFGIFVDSSGNVYTTGYFQSPVGDVDFDPGEGTFPLTSTGNADIFISKLDSNGNFVGAWAMGGTTDDFGYGIFVDTSGDIYSTGYFQFTADFDPGTGALEIFELTSEGFEDIFVSKLNSSGNFVWAKNIGGISADVGLGLSRYSSGSIYVTGWFRDTVVFGPGAGSISLTSKGIEDIFISKLDGNNGDVVWAKSIGGVSLDKGEAVSVDSSGNVYTTGLFNGTVDFNPDPGSTPASIFELTSTGSSDIFISKLDDGGNFVWAKAMGSASSSDIGYGISVDPLGNVYTTGIFQGTDVDFDPGGGIFPLTSAGLNDVFISKLNNSGDFVWAKAMGGILDDVGWDIFADSSGAVYTTGSFKGTADFDPGSGTSNLVSNGFEDIFIIKLAGRATAFPWTMFLPAIMNHPQP